LGPQQQSSAVDRPPAKSADLPKPVEPPILAEVRHCPLCQGPLVEENGLYHCRGRCRARWIETGSDQLIDLAVLPYGICTCCTGPQVLVRGEHGAVCPRSGVEYLLRPDGPHPLAEAAPHGLCRCCIPPQPLIRVDDQLACQARPDYRYQWRGNQLCLIIAGSAPANSSQTLKAIDEALCHNTAHLTVNGLFDLG
jgi:hypothetical protein